MSAFPYRIIRSDRKSIALQILSDGTLTVRCPRRTTREQIESLLASKGNWIRKHLAGRTPVTKLTASQLQTLRSQASASIPALVSAYARQIGVDYGNISIRAQKTRWGSCSSKGNLNFNCLLMLAPPRVLEYVIVHELCHRRHMNHSQAFWELVTQWMPDWNHCRRWLKENGASLLAQIP